MDASASPRLTRAERVRTLHGIYAIVNEGPDAVSLVQACVEAGVRVVQYRAKRAIVPDHLHRIRALTHDARVLLIMNDDWRAAQAYACDGVHLGPDDAGFTHVRSVREAMGDRLIGLSCGTVDEVRRANASDVDYVGVGSVYTTHSKDDAGLPIGIDGLRRVAAATSLPVAAIGGITIARTAEVARIGVAMAAVISAIAQANDPRAAAVALVRAWEQAAP